MTKAMLERSISVLQAHQPWADYSIGWAYGQPRLEAKNGSVDISPRGTKRQVNEYIWMMIRALQMAEAHERDVVRDRMDREKLDAMQAAMRTRSK